MVVCIALDAVYLMAQVDTHLATAGEFCNCLVTPRKSSWEGSPDGSQGAMFTAPYVQRCSTSWCCRILVTAVGATQSLPCTAASCNPDQMAL